MYNLLVKYDLEHNGKKYKTGSIIKSDNKVEMDRLTRKGCIFVEEKAEYKQDEKKVEAIVEPEEIVETVKKKTKKKVRKNVTDKDTKQAEIQAESAVQE